MLETMNSHHLESGTAKMFKKQTDILENLV